MTALAAAPARSSLRPSTRPPASDLLVTGVALAIGLAMVATIAFDAGAAVAVVVALGVAVLAPQVGLATLAFLAPLKEPLVVPSPGFNFMLVAAILLGCLYRLPIDRPRLRLSLVHAAFGAFVLYAGLQQLPQMIAGYPGAEDHVGYLFFQLSAVLGAVVAAAYLLPGRSPYPVVAAAVAGAVVASGLAIATYADVKLPPIVNLSVITTLSSARASGPFENPNYMAMFAATALVASVGLWPVWRSRLARTALVATMVVLATGIALSQSRGGILACLAGLGVLAIARNRWLGVTLILLGVLSAVVLYPAFTEWRLTNLRGEASGAGYVSMAASDDGRLSAALAGPAIFLSSPIFGVGLGQYGVNAVTIGGLTAEFNSHNWYSNVLAEQGLVGATLWIALIAGLISALRAIADTPWRRLGYAVLASVLIACMFTEAPRSFQNVTLTTLVLTAVLVADWRRRGATDPRAPAPEAAGRLAAAGSA